MSTFESDFKALFAEFEERFAEAERIRITLPYEAADEYNSIVRRFGKVIATHQETLDMIRAGLKKFKN